MTKKTQQAKKAKLSAEQVRKAQAANAKKQAQTAKQLKKVKAHNKELEKRSAQSKSNVQASASTKSKSSVQSKSSTKPKSSVQTSASTKPKSSVKASASTKPKSSVKTSASTKPKSNVQASASKNPKSATHTKNNANSKQSAKSKSATHGKRKVSNTQSVNRGNKVASRTKNSKAAISKSIKRQVKKYQETAAQQEEIKIYNEAVYETKLKNNATKAMLGVSLVFAALFSVVLLSILQLQLTHTRFGVNLEQYANDVYISNDKLEGERGRIYDAQSNVLATNAKVYDVVAILSPDYECVNSETSKRETCNIEDPSDAASKLAKAFGKEGDAETIAYLESQMSQTDLYQTSFGKLGTGISYAQKMEIEEAKIRGIIFEERQLRYYPYGDFASYIVGYAKPDDTGEIVGEMGIEKSTDGYLRGSDGIIREEFDMFGIKLTEKQSQSIPSSDGADVYLTIDATIQSYVQSSMEKQLANVEGTPADQLFTIVMDAKTGGILAAQTVPSFDPNVLDIKNYVEPFTTYCFEPGSTFKSFTAATAIDTGKWDDDRLDASGKRFEEDWEFTIGDWNAQNGWGKIPWKVGFYMSSNVIMTRILDEIGDDTWLQYVTEKFLFGTPVKTEFFETTACEFKPQYSLEYATSTYGQGITVNAMQLLRGYSAFTNGGNRLTPHFVQKMVDSDENKEIYNADNILKSEQIIKEETAKDILNLMRGVVTYKEGDTTGTASMFEGSRYPLGVKTGSAQIAMEGSYTFTDIISSSITVAPYDDPQIIIYTLAVRPVTTDIPNIYMPAYVKEIADKSLDYIYSSNTGGVVDKEYDYYEVENYIGKNVDGVKQKLESENVSVLAIGTGKVKSQYPKNGQLTLKGDLVIVVGEENVETPELIGRSPQDALAICGVLSLECEVQGLSSQVVGVDVVDNKYILQLTAEEKETKSESSDS